ncbi:MAG: proline--tRNA ligase [Candidatus Marinimicrobia bacterium]|nr:proline--tRNA ligase [Candidatus Neomarinimicrobiota bacterium]
MRMSQLFTRTLREAPKDEVSLNAQLLTKGGFIKKLSAGVYSFLPLGLRVFKKIENIIREEMDLLGGQEILMPVLHPKELWEESGRWETADYLYKLKDRQKAEFALGATHEEAVTDIVRKYVSSYRDLPLLVYQIQTKFRDELRPKSGLLRGREFSMKDLYSFHKDDENRKKYYKAIENSYLKIFKRCGFNDVFVTEASGGSFSSEYSHEFQVPTDAGEDLVIYCQNCGFTQNKEICDLRQGDDCPNCERELKDIKTIEVGNIFSLGSKYSKPMGLSFLDSDGIAKPVVMGCYGIGLSRLMGAAAEIHNDERGVMWPKEISPFDFIIVQLSSNNPEVNEKIKRTAERIYERAQEKGFSVLYDDREDKGAGEKFTEADLFGIPWRVVVSERTLAENKVELKERGQEDVILVNKGKLLESII